nr:hypothetical protein [uncultured Albidiferax sp.]
MTRKLFLTLAAAVAALVGAIALIAPAFLLTTLKGAVPNAAALVMARTTGLLLLTVALTAFLVRGHADSPSMEAILTANLALQLGLIPMDPMAYMSGAFTTIGSFAPNTVIHLVLATGFAYYLVKLRKALAVSRKSQAAMNALQNL